MIYQLMENGDDVDMGFLDFNKAFRVINHVIICAEIAALWVSSQVLDWVPGFLANRSSHMAFLGAP